MAVSGDDVRKAIADTSGPFCWHESLSHEVGAQVQFVANATLARTSQLQFRSIQRVHEPRDANTYLLSFAQHQLMLRRVQCQLTLLGT